MGASGWHHFVPYQLDINNALQEVRQRVFEQGKYYKRSYDELRNKTDAELQADVANETSEIQEIVLHEWQYLRALPEPTTIEQLVAWNFDSGTHSIIDITDGVSDQPEFGTVSPLTDQQLIDLFSTTQPTHAAVLNQLELGSLYKLRKRWEGFYIVVYENNMPVEICFAGFSGD